MSKINGKAKLAQAAINVSKESKQDLNTGGKSDPTMRYHVYAPAIPSELEPPTSEALVDQFLSFPRWFPSTMSSKHKLIAMDNNVFPKSPAADTQVNAEKQYLNQDIGLLESETERTAVNSKSAGSSTNTSTKNIVFHSIMQSYSGLISQLLERITKLEKTQADILQKASALIITKQTQQRENQALKLALSTVRQDEAKKIMAEVTEEMKVKCDEAELKSIELRFEKAGLESENKKLEEENKKLRDLVTRFEHLYGDIDEAEVMDGDY